MLAPYLHHRRTGRPYVVLKLAASLDGRTAAPRRHAASGSPAPRPGPMPTRLRAESDAILVGAGTVRRRRPEPHRPRRPGPRGDPERIVLGDAPRRRQGPPVPRAPRATSATCSTSSGAKGHLQLLVEGGATVAHAFHQQGLVDRYVLYLAPALFGGDDARGLFAGAGAAVDRRRVARPHRCSVTTARATTCASTSTRETR